MENIENHTHDPWPAPRHRQGSPGISIQQQAQECHEGTICAGLNKASRSEYWHEIYFSKKKKYQKY